MNFQQDYSDLSENDFVNPLYSVVKAGSLPTTADVAPCSPLSFFGFYQNQLSLNSAAYLAKVDTTLRPCIILDYQISPEKLCLVLSRVSFYAM